MGKSATDFLVAKLLREADELDRGASYLPDGSQAQVTTRKQAADKRSIAAQLSDGRQVLRRCDSESGSVE